MTASMVFVFIVLACLFFVLVGLAVGLLVGGMAKVSDDPLYDEALADSEQAELLAELSRAMRARGADRASPATSAGLIEQAMGKAAYSGNVPEEGEDTETIEDDAEAALLLPAG